MNNPLISRKEIAQMLGVSEQTVRRNESRWGIGKADGVRVDLNPRMVRYHFRLAIREFVRRGFVK